MADESDLATTLGPPAVASKPPDRDQATLSNPQGILRRLALRRRPGEFLSPILALAIKFALPQHELVMTAAANVPPEDLEAD
jgi:hypothetical protein